MAFLGINISASALAATRKQMEIVGQNAANVNNPAYNRQRAILATSEPLTGKGPTRALGSLHLGTGVVIERIQRLHASFLDGQVASLTGQQGEATLRGQVATQIESIFVEPSDTGIQARLSRFFAAFDALAVNPSEPALRQSVTTAGRQLGEVINDAISHMAIIRDETVTQTQDFITQTNDLSRQIADLSTRILDAFSGGAQPNDLLDRRDALIDKLTELTGAIVNGRQIGEVIVSIDGRTIVQGNIVHELAYDRNEPEVVIRMADTGDVLKLRSSTLRGIQTAVNETIPSLQQELFSLRDSLVSAVNAQHQAGTDGFGNAGGDFFLIIDSEMRVNPALEREPRLIAAGLTAASGDGDNALALAGIRNVAISNGRTAASLYNRLITEVAHVAREGADRLDRVDALMQQIRGLQANESGVDLDEEMVDMINLQHTFAANARMLTIFDQMLNTLINKTGIVGR